MAIQILEPPPSLRQFVTRYWYYEETQHSDLKSTIRILPTGAPGIIFQHSNGRSKVFDPLGSPLPVSFVHGQATKPCLNQITDKTFVFGIDLKPSALKTFFRIDASELTNSVVALEELLGHGINDQLLHAGPPAQLSDLFSSSLRRLAGSVNPDPLFESCLKLVKDEIDTIRPGMLPASLHISQRQFQRIFKQNIGLKAETWLRILKFQQALQMLKSFQYQKMSDIAYNLGYTDPSHFIRTFKDFSGYTPGQFLRVVTKRQPFQPTMDYPLKPLRILTEG